MNNFCTKFAAPVYFSMKESDGCISTFKLPGTPQGTVRTCKDKVNNTGRE